MPNEARSNWIDERVTVLEGSDAPENLLTAAGELAYSDDPRALETLGSFLSRSEFVERLDPPDAEPRIANLSGVFEVLKGDPSPETARLCLRLVDLPLYQEHGRRLLVLEALAAVVPMSQEAAAAFRRANDEDYFAFDARLLAKNSSQPALDVYLSMMLEEAVEAEVRVELIHAGILPYRNRLTIVRTAAALIESTVDPLIAEAAIESVFDYQRSWFQRRGPTPPLWRTAADEVLRVVLQLGSALIDQKKAPAPLTPAIVETNATVRALLAARAG